MAGFILHCLATLQEHMILQIKFKGVFILQKRRINAHKSTSIIFWMIHSAEWIRNIVLSILKYSKPDTK